jgi:Holliday junction resolvase RusA-like endonuclease
MTKPYKLILEIPGLPKMANIESGKSHWRHQHREAKRWKEAVAELAQPRPPKPLKRYRLRLIRFSSVEPDYDGLVKGFKHPVDGLKAAGIIADDKLSNSGAWRCHWKKAKQKEGKILIVVSEVRS